MEPPQRLELVVDHEITLRQFAPCDAPTIFSVIDRNRDWLSQHGDITASKYPTEESVYESIINPPNPLRLRFGIITAGALVGTVNLTLDSDQSLLYKRAEIGAWVGKEYSRKGYCRRSINGLVKYGFETLGLDEIWALVNKENQESISMITQAGFSVQEERSTPEEWYFFKLGADFNFENSSHFEEGKGR